MSRTSDAIGGMGRCASCGRVMGWRGRRRSQDEVGQPPTLFPVNQTPAKAGSGTFVVWVEQRGASRTPEGIARQGILVQVHADPRPFRQRQVATNLHDRIG